VSMFSEIPTFMLTSGRRALADRSHRVDSE
jgi:hypothetical protein